MWRMMCCVLRPVEDLVDVENVEKFKVFKSLHCFFTVAKCGVHFSPASWINNNLPGLSILKGRSLLWYQFCHKDQMRKIYPCEESKHNRGGWAILSQSVCTLLALFFHLQIAHQVPSPICGYTVSGKCHLWGCVLRKGFTTPTSTLCSHGAKLGLSVCVNVRVRHIRFKSILQYSYSWVNKSCKLVGPLVQKVLMRLWDLNWKDAAHRILLRSNCKKKKSHIWSMYHIKIRCIHILHYNLQHQVIEEAMAKVNSEHGFSSCTPSWILEM